MMKLAAFTVVLASVLTTWCGNAASAGIHVDPETYAAIAYSPSTGDYSFACDFPTLSEAQEVALARCPQSDARIVGWTRNGFIALAVGDDRTQWGVATTQGAGASSKAAKRLALDEINKRTGQGRVVLCLVSDGQYIYLGY